MLMVMRLIREPCNKLVFGRHFFMNMLLWILLKLLSDLEVSTCQFIVVVMVWKLM